MRNSITFLLLAGTLLLVFGILVATEVIMPTTDDRTETPTESATSPISRFNSQQELNNFVQSAQSTREYGLSSGFQQQATRRLESADAGGTAAGPSGRDYSTTNVQVAGIDEADIAKNDGTFLYTIADDFVSIIRAYPPEEAAVIANLTIDKEPQQLFVINDSLIVFAQERQNIGIPEPVAPDDEGIKRPRRSAPVTSIYSYDISSRSQPQLQRNITAKGTYVDARLLNGTVHTILHTPADTYNDTVALPWLQDNGQRRTIPASDIGYIDTPAETYRYTQVLSFAATETEDTLQTETLLTDTSHELYVSHDNIYLTRTQRMDTQKILDQLINDAILPIVPDTVQSELTTLQNSDLRGYRSYTYLQAAMLREILSNYTRSLSTNEQKAFAEQLNANMEDVALDLHKQVEQTAIYRLAIHNNGTVSPAARGTVPGSVLDQFSMSEQGNHFRIATTTEGVNNMRLDSSFIPSLDNTAVSRTTETTNEVTEQSISQATTDEEILAADSLNHLYVLDMNLSTTGSVENLAPDESIHSARFMHNRAYLVTFRQIDPLFALNLSEPKNPQVLGELKITGVSEYLHPYDKNHLIGIGRAADREGRQEGLKVSVFNVSDPQQPKETASHTFGQDWSHSRSFSEHKAVLFDRSRNLLAFPADVQKSSEDFQGAYVFNITQNTIDLQGTISHTDDRSQERRYYARGPDIRRLFYIENMLYTLSDTTTRIHQLPSLTEQRTLQLPTYPDHQVPVKEPQPEPAIERDR